MSHDMLMVVIDRFTKGRENSVLLHICIPCWYARNLCPVAG